MRHVYRVTSFSRITLAAKNVHVHVSCFAIDPKLISVVTGRAWADWTLDSTTTRVRLSRSRERIVSLMCEHPQRTLSAAYLVNAECVNFSFIDDVKVDLINITLRLTASLTISTYGCKLCRRSLLHLPEPALREIITFPNRTMGFRKTNHLKFRLFSPCTIMYVYLLVSNSAFVFSAVCTATSALYNNPTPTHMWITH